jgi:hypothetical protein
MYTSPLSINGQALLISTINDISKETWRRTTGPIK